jgi:hypothetical protein
MARLPFQGALSTISAGLGKCLIRWPKRRSRRSSLNKSLKREQESFQAETSRSNARGPVGRMRNDEFDLTAVLFAPPQDEPRCRLHLETGKPLSIAGVMPSGKPRRCTGIVISIKRDTILHPGYPLMVTLAEKLSENGE